MQDLLTTAIEMHRTGQFGPAAQLYQRVLSQEEENCEALHLLGLLHHQQADHTRAVELICRAIAIRPNIPLYHANLAESYRALGQFERAAGCCRTALRLWPNYVEAICNLGLALQAQGQTAQAIEQFRLGLDLRPAFAPLHNNLGIALRALGQFDEALASFRRAVELDSAFAPAQSNLGQMLLDRGHAEEALPYAQEAARLQPDVAAMHHNLGNALRALGKSVDARAAYLEAIRLDSKLAQSYGHVGMMLQQEGQPGDALVWLEQATEMAPNEAAFWESLAELHFEREEPAAAIPCWRRALTLAPDRALLHNGLGLALDEEGRGSEAAEHYRAAIKLQPDFAVPWMNLGGVHEQLGEMGDAEMAFREALRVQPDFALPYAHLALLLRGKLADSDLAALQQRIADPELGEAPRARMLFGLAQVRDARADYRGAAEVLRQANAIAFEHAQRRKRTYNPEDHQRFVDDLIDVFGAGWFAGLAGAGSDTRRPVFVLGLPRSGTTLIEQALAAHSRVYGAGELRLAREVFEAIPRILGRSEAPLSCVSQLTPAAIVELSQRHLDGLAALDGGSNERIVDKMPDNYLYLGFLAALFPRATFILCRRDLRDVALSCWMTDFRSIRWANDQGQIVSRFQQFQRLIDHWKSVLPVPIHEVVYEEAVADFEGTVRRLLRACELEWEPRCLAFHRERRPVRTASLVQVRQPIYKHSVARWKNYANELAGLFDALPVH